MPPEPECEDAKRNFTLASQAKQSEVRGKSAHGRAAAKGLQPRATAAPTGTNQGDFVMLFFSALRNSSKMWLATTRRPESQSQDPPGL